MRQKTSLHEPANDSFDWLSFRAKARVAWSAMDKLLRSAKNLRDTTERLRIIRQAQAQKARVLSKFAKHAHLLDLETLKLRVYVLFE